MPSATLLIDPMDPLLQQKLAALPKCPGYCIFIDVVGSTALKQKGIHHWVACIHNSFSHAKTFVGVFRPLKGIGDELMYYIEEADLITSGETPLTLYDGLFQIAGSGSPSASMPDTKIAVAYCDSVYPMTFISGTVDYYGADIDRAARLKSVTPSLTDREIVMDDGFYNRLMSSYNNTGNQFQFSSVKRITGPSILNAKGIVNPVNFFRVKA
jgi:hypothetical protein